MDGWLGKLIVAALTGAATFLGTFWLSRSNIISAVNARIEGHCARQDAEIARQTREIEKLRLEHANCRTELDEMWAAMRAQGIPPYQVKGPTP